MEPEEVYTRCKKAGMDFVTISDHNCIRGALEIAHYPDTFISSELTTYFPENGCKIHCLVTGITPNQFADLQTARENIYDLQAYLNRQDIIHSIAHPLFRINDKLTVDLFEKLLVMFNRFEGINGSRDMRACEVSNAILTGLTRDDLEKMADRHGLIPVGSDPWKKKLTGGSDDHGGLYVASAWTATPHAADAGEFLEHLRCGRHGADGTGGSSVRLANSIYKISYQFYRARFSGDKAGGADLVGAMLRKMAGESSPDAAPAGGIRNVIKKIIVKKKQRQLSRIEQMILDEFSRAVEDHNRPLPEAESDRGQRIFHSACRVSQQLSYTFLNQFMTKLSEGSLVNSLQAFSSIIPVLLGVTPYLTAFTTQHKDEAFLREICGRFPVANTLHNRSNRRAWITDTFDDVNGVSHTIHTLAGLSHDQGRPITVLTCLENPPQTAFPHKNFTPVGSFSLPEYESQKMAFPPFLEILHYLEQEKVDELIISTPGPMGLCGLMAARILGLRVKGFYHTDFPKFVQNITDDDALEEVTWKFMRWFYRDMEAVYAPTEQYGQLLVNNGFNPAAVRVLPRGVDLTHFSPDKRRNNFWAAYNLNGGFKFLYVGRVSKEKNLDNMIKGFLSLLEENPEVDLVIVGDGPYCEELRARYPHRRIAFTGFLYGEELQTAYASADAFVFPSMTDTFGNAVLEAHASGLPAIVSNSGGPQEIVSSHRSGLVIDARTPQAFKTAMGEILNHADKRNQLKTAALRKAADSGWDKALAVL